MQPQENESSANIMFLSRFCGPLRIDERRRTYSPPHGAVAEGADRALDVLLVDRDTEQKPADRFLPWLRLRHPAL